MPKNVFSIIKRHTMLNKRKLAYLKTCAIDLVKDKTPGDVVECGVWMGGGSALVAHTLVEMQDIRTFRLFDSFKDICEPSNVDGDHIIRQVGGEQNAQGRLIPVTGFYKKLRRGGPGNPKIVFSLFTKVVGYPKDKVKIYKGWFQNTIPVYKNRIDKIALLILDCDLYASTAVCLEHLYDKLSVGGKILIDDYYSYSGCKKAVDEFLILRGATVRTTPAGYVYYQK